MVHKYGKFNLRVFEVDDSTIDEKTRKVSCEIFAVDDVEFQNRLDETWVTVKKTDSASVDIVEALLLFIDYAKKYYSDLLRAAEAPLDNVMEDAFRRSFGGWTFCDGSEENLRDDCRKDILEDLGFC